MPLLRSITAAVAALLLAVAAPATDVSPVFADRFSISGTAPLPAGSPAFTLLDPQWLLPPIESLEAAAVLADGAARADQILRDDATAASRPPAPAAAEGPMSYSLSDNLKADVDYHRVQLFDRADSQTLRNQTATAFSRRSDRDVLDLNMSWRLAGSTVGLGYQLESARVGNTGDLGLGRFMPGNQQATHSLTLGLTRAWGAPAPPPAPIEPPLLSPPLDAAAAEASPTPAS